MTEYIDRKKVIDIINATCPDFNIPEVNNSWVHKLIVIIREALVELVKGEPAADVRENVKGKWLPMYDGTEQGDCYQCGCYCSNCGLELQSEPNFCPNCGADMRGEKDG